MKLELKLPKYNLTDWERNEDILTEPLLDKILKYKLLNSICWQCMETRLPTAKNYHPQGQRNQGQSLNRLERLSTECVSIVLIPWMLDDEWEHFFGVMLNF